MHLRRRISIVLCLPALALKSKRDAAVAANRITVTPGENETASTVVVVTEQ